MINTGHIIAPFLHCLRHAVFEYKIRILKNMVLPSPVSHLLSSMAHLPSNQVPCVYSPIIICSSESRVFLKAATCVGLYYGHKARPKLSWPVHAGKGRELKRLFGDKWIWTNNFFVVQIFDSIVQISICTTRSTNLYYKKIKLYYIVQNLYNA